MCIFQINHLLRKMLAFLSVIMINLNIAAQSFNNQEYHVSYMDVSSGLSNNYVRNMIEDDFGFKWIATEGGLNKYDGRSFQIFKPSNTPALKNENIEVVYKDSSGDLWIGTKSGGLSFYNSRTEQFHNYNEPVFNEVPGQGVRVTFIVEDQSNHLFVGTWSNGLFVFNKDSAAHTVRYFKYNKVNRLATDNYGNVWILVGNQIFKYDPSENRMIKISQVEGVTSICHDRNRNRLWLGMSGSEVGYLDLDDYTVHKVFMNGIQENKGYHVESMALDQDGRLFIGTWGAGLFISDTTATQFTKFSIHPSDEDYKNTSFETILDIHLDDTGIIWVSTAFGGIVKLMPVNSFTGLDRFLSEYSLADNNIYSTTTDPQGNIWIGTYGAGVSLIRDHKVLRMSQLPVSKINTFLAVGDKMIIGCREGFYAVNYKNPLGPYQRHFGQLSKITSLFLANNGRLWIGTQQQGLYYVDDYLQKPNDSKCVSVKNWKGGDRISKIVQAANGDVWIGTFNGLFVYQPEENTFSRLDQLIETTLPSEIINDLYLDKQTQTLWVALSGGLVEMNLDGSNILNVNVNGIDQGLKNEFITSVTKGSDDQIWIGTAYGLAKYRPERKVFENYGKFEGVPAQSFNIKSVTQLPDGRLLFGAADGLVVFDPQKITYHQADPEVLFTGLSINGESVNVGEEINGHVILNQSLQYTSQVDLTYKDETFSFTVSTLDYLGEDNVLFSYRLVGFNDTWSKLSTNREIRYINLTPGMYRLEVKASRDGFNWSAVASKNITVYPPPWGTWYAYVLYVSFILGLTYLVNYIAKRQAKLQAKLEVERIAREKEHDLSEAKIKFFTNISHEFRTPLTLILSPITELLMDQQIATRIRERLTTVEKNASRLLQLINQLLDFRKSENGLLQLRVAHGDFVMFAKEVFLSFKTHSEAKKINYTFKSKPSRIVLPFDRDKMEIALVNLLSNAFKYTPSGGTIQLRVEESGPDCSIQVIDSGSGIQLSEIDKVFDRFYQIKSTDSAKIIGSGIGLSLTRNIVELHHGTISVESTPKERTIFKINIPIDNKGFSPEEFIEDFKSSEDRTAYEDALGEVGSDSHQIDDDLEHELVLVVDDNDEILNYLSVLIKEEGYEVIQASNGVDALEIANEQHPDLIVSDIMMPEMDGITLCSTLKNDMNTSHIPVILLTARTSTVYEVSGLETGADDYIKKPFHPAVVKTRINGLLDNRRKVREYFVNKLRFEPSQKIDAIGAEEKFIQEAITIIEEHIHDAEFGIENLMDSLAMSKSTLYRKLKSLTGLSITAFIRSVKLKKAAELILTVDWKLNQIAYESGFNDYKYFKNCFQEQFGCLPSEYRSRKSSSTTEKVN